MARSTQPFKRLRHDAEVVDLTLDDDDAPARSHGSSAKMEGLGMRSMEARPKRQPPQERSTRNNPINLISPEPEDRHRTRSDVVMSDAPVPETRRERRGKPAQSDDTREKTTPKKAEAWRPWTPEKAEASVPSNLVENGKPRRGNATNDATMNDFSRRRRVNQLEDDSRVLDATAGAADVNRQPQALPKKTKTPPAPPIQFDPLPEITFQPVPKKQVKKFTDWTAPNVPLEYGAIAELWEKFQEEFKEDHARFACVNVSSCDRCVEVVLSRYRTNSSEHACRTRKPKQHIRKLTKNSTPKLLPLSTSQRQTGGTIRPSVLQPPANPRITNSPSRTNSASRVPRRPNFTSL
jgi:hypothetical protein